MKSWQGLTLLILGGLSLALYQNCGDPKAIHPEEYQIEDQIVTTAESDLTPEDSLDIAMTLYQRLGARASIESEVIVQMTELVEQGDLKGAALLATNEDEFYNIVVKDFATKMSNREERMNSPLNDFVATFIGAIRDDIDGRELLSGDFYYAAPDVAGVRSNPVRDLVKSNNHYNDLEEDDVNLAQNLVRQDQQMVSRNGTSTLDPLEDAAGVITSRAFMSSHALGGTNRRLVEFSFSQFLCSPIEEWADISLPGFYIGRDIGRHPQSLFNNKCRGCHAPMDAMRTAFAHVNFSTRGFIEYKVNVRFDPSEANAAILNVPVPVEEQLVPSKFRRGKTIFEDGHKVTDDSWENFTSDRFQWNGPTTGNGMKAFGRMIAESNQFGLCMAKRVFETVCYQKLNENDTNIMEELAKGFSDSGYNFRDLFAEALIRPECLGESL